jgi:hypothetical protein
LWEKETSWAHIVALQYVITQFGCPLKYYVDNHSIFRFVEHRDSIHTRSLTKEDKAMVQWKAVLDELGIEVAYALSPAAKGKIERPYHWLQDHLVRTCARQEIRNIEEARKILYEEIYHYNFQRVHSTTQEIPVRRFEKCLAQKLNFFRRFEIKKPYERLEDIFCYRFKRVSDSYRKISFNNLKFSLHHVPPHSEVELRISCDPAGRFTLIRFWYRGRLVGQQPIKSDDLAIVQF